MNLVNCSASCVHQKEGVCTIEKLSPTGAITVGGCLYFSPAVPSEKSLLQQTSDLPHRADT